METYSELKPNKGIAIALGYFDGMHQGHRKIIKTLVQNAKELQVKTAVITFNSNPANFFNKEPVKNIQSSKDKELILSSLGVDYLYELNFEELMHYSADEYLNEIIMKYYNPKLIVVGYNHTFGKDRSGNSSYLQSKASEMGFSVNVVPEQKYNNIEQISSSQIRSRIHNGHLNAVKALLGRNFSIRNSVIKGAQLARTLGYPTANLVWPESIVKLPYGVYFGYCQIESHLYTALISWGTKPTLTSGVNETLEAHIYNFNDNLYGKIIKVIFVKKIRNEENFGGLKALKEQLDKDFFEFEKWAKANSK